MVGEIAFYLVLVTILVQHEEIMLTSLIFFQRLMESDGFEPSIFASVSQGELRMEKTAFRRNRLRSSSSRAEIPKGERFSW